MQKYISRKVIILTIIGLIIVGLLVSVIIYISSFSSINVSMNNCSSLVLYKSLPESEEKSYSDIYKNAKPIKTIVKNGSYNIKKGNYRYFAKPINQDYQEETKQIIVNSNNQDLSVNLTYTRSKLNEMYKTELPKILDALNKKYPIQMKSYTVNYGKLYETGNWFAGYLVPADGSDMLQVILKQKDSNYWEVAATPNITISNAQYPAIPSEVIKGVNVFPK